MLHKLVKTDSDYGLTLSRLVLGTLFFIHGHQLMLGSKCRNSLIP
jgi:hypothetical protein